MRSRLEGLLVSSGSSDAPTASPADKFPLAAYAPYKDSSYPWNPNGSGISDLDIRIPIFYLEESLRASAYSSALQNRQQVLHRPSCPQACRSFIITRERSSGQPGRNKEGREVCCKLQSVASIEIGAEYGIQSCMTTVTDSVAGCMQGYRGALHVASLDATMWAEGNAPSCIQAATCLPLGVSQTFAMNARALHNTEFAGNYSSGP